MKERHETMVRMGAVSVSSDDRETLVSIGLGSCIGVALVDRDRGVAGLAHVMLPSSREGAGSDGEGKFADLAVPLLLDRVARKGARKAALTAVLVGGAQMFAANGGSTLDIGGRNERAVLDSLATAGVRVAASATRGSTGRTIRVYVGSGRVTVREAGGAETDLLTGGRA